MASDRSHEDGKSRRVIVQKCLLSLHAVSG
jgi:hypothetical protein